MDLGQYPQTMPTEKVIASILKNPPSMGIDTAVDTLLNMRMSKITSELIEDVLKHMYGHGPEALRFFKWSGLRLGHKHLPSTWNLLIDCLGRSLNFDQMWDCVKVMKSENMVTVQTFGTIFGCYAAANKPNEATMSFDFMDQYGCSQDITSLNLLISALCKNKLTGNAVKLLEKISTDGGLQPDMKTYALLLQGWEKEANVDKAWKTFGEMIVRIGWKPENVSAYTAILGALVNGNRCEEATKALNVMLSKNCLPDFSVFSIILQTLYQRKDIKNAYAFWEAVMKIMKQCGTRPDNSVYNTMIGVFCSAGHIEYAYRLLDEMPFCGAFPDFKSYNRIFEALIAAKRIDEATSIFREMTSNDLCPLYGNYVSAIKMYFDADDPEMAVEMWRHMIEKNVGPKPDCVAEMIYWFCEHGRISEALMYCEEAIEKGVSVPADAMTKLRHGLSREAKEQVFAKLEKKIRGLARAPN